jgi:hypothetical protein
MPRVSVCSRALTYVSCSGYQYQHESGAPARVSTELDATTTETYQADGSAAGVALLPFSVDSPAADDMRRLERLVWVVIVSFILVGAVLLPFRVVGAAWGLYRGCEQAHGQVPRGGGGGGGAHELSESDPGSAGQKRRDSRRAGSSGSFSILPAAMVDSPVSPGRRRGGAGHGRSGGLSSSSSSREYRALSAPDPSPVRP